MTKILFIGNMETKFIERDYKILKKHFSVDAFDIKYTNPISYAKKLLKISHHVKKCDIVFSWFANWHSAVATHYARKYGKKSIVVAGGYDVACIPEIGYGTFSKAHERIPAKYVLKNADLVLPFSNFSKDEIIRRGINPKNMQVVYMGIDTNEFKPSGNKENIVRIAVTVGAINKSNLKRKGIEKFVKSAKYLPDVRFVVIGKPQDKSIEYLKSIAPSNVEFTGFVNDKELLKWYQRAKVYVQPSMHEGFGVAVAEAMACACIPVVTNIGALPEVVKYAGFYTPIPDEKLIAEKIRTSLNTSDEYGMKARERIVNNFPMEKREKQLVKIINEVIE